MKQKNGHSQVITKAYLDKTFDERFKVLDEAFDERFEAYDKKMDGRFKLSEINTDIKLENLERRVDEKAQQYRDQVLTSNDKIMRELEVMREENAIGFNQLARLGNKVDDHEKRIKVLESS